MGIGRLTLRGGRRFDDSRFMQLTPLGFVSQAEDFLKEALSLPPLGGGNWAFQRTVNLHEHSGSLQVILHQPSGSRKTRAVLQARLTGGPRDAGIQGWAEFEPNEERDTFVLKQNDSVYACEEVFDIVERILSRLPEWDKGATIERPAAPPPRPRVSFEPLIPQIQKIEPVAPAAPEPAAAEAEGEGVSSTQAFVDSLLSPDAFEEPPAAEAEQEPPAPQAGPLSSKVRLPRHADAAKEKTPEAPVAEKSTEKKGTKPAAKGKPGRKPSK